MITIQLLSIIVGLAAIHLTYLYYKRTYFTKKELFIWLFIWLTFIFISTFPRSMTPIVGYLGLSRSMDLIMVVAFIILFILAFHSYVFNRKQERKITKLVQELALKDFEK